MLGIQLATLILQIGLVYYVRKNMANTQRLVAAVQHLTTVSTSIIALVTSMASQIRDNVGDPDALNSLADTIENQANELAAAVIANTPAAPTQPGQVENTAADAGSAVPPDANGGDSDGSTDTVSGGDNVAASESPGEQPNPGPTTTEGAESLPTAGDVVNANDGDAPIENQTN